MLLAVGSVKGSPGATTLAVGLAARWPQPGVVLVEADPAGGDLAARFGCHPVPGLVGLTAAARRSAEPDLLTEYAQPIGLGVTAVVGSAGRAAAGTVAELAARGLDLLRHAAAQRPVIVDMGRLDAGSPALPLLAAVDVLLLVAHTALPVLQHVDVRRDEFVDLVGSPDRVQLVLRGGGSAQFAVSSVGRDLGLPVAGTLPHDETGAGLLSGRLTARRWWTRARLVRAAHAMAVTLATRPIPSPPTAAPLTTAAGPPAGGLVEVAT